MHASEQRPTSPFSMLYPIVLELEGGRSTATQRERDGGVTRRHEVSPRRDLRDAVHVSVAEQPVRQENCVSLPVARLHTGSEAPTTCSQSRYRRSVFYWHAARSDIPIHLRKI